MVKHYVFIQKNIKKIKFLQNAKNLLPAWNNNSRIRWILRTNGLIWILLGLKRIFVKFGAKAGLSQKASVAALYKYKRLFVSYDI